jgi:tyrosinase
MDHIARRHAMIDRLWRLWQLRHPTAVVPADLLGEAFAPFNITVAQDNRRQCAGL